MSYIMLEPRKQERDVGGFMITPTFYNLSHINFTEAQADAVIKALKDMHFRGWEDGRADIRSDLRSLLNIKEKED